MERNLSLDPGGGAEESKIKPPPVPVFLNAINRRARKRSGEGGIFYKLSEKCLYRGFGG